MEQCLGGVAAGEAANENPKNKAKKVVAAGIGGGVGGAVLGTLGAPLVGGTFAAKAYYDVAVHNLVMTNNSIYIVALSFLFFISHISLYNM